MNTSENCRTEPRQRARRGQGDRLRDEILDAAERLFVETGDADCVSIRSIGQIVGVTAPSIYRHFADKDALLLATSERALDRFGEYVGGEAQAGTELLHEIKNQARAYLRFALNNPGQYRFLFMTPCAAMAGQDGLEGKFDPSKSKSNPLARLEAVIQATIDSGEIRTTASTTQLALLLWSIVHGIASLRISFPEMPWLDIDEQINTMFGVLGAGLRTDKKSSSQRRPAVVNKL